MNKNWPGTELKVGSGSFLPVQEPDSRVQIGCEGDPENVRNLKECGRLFHPSESQDHPDNQRQEQSQHNQRAAVGLKAEEKENIVFELMMLNYLQI